MTKLPTQFQGRADQRGFHFTQIHREGSLAIYKKQKHDSWVSYEVFFVLASPKKTWPDGRVTEAREIPPSPEKWGTLAWSCPTLEAARQKFNAVSKATQKSFQN